MNSITSGAIVRRNLETLLIITNWSLETLKERAEVTLEEIHEVLNESTEVKLITIEKIATAFCVTTSHLLKKGWE